MPDFEIKVTVTPLDGNKDSQTSVRDVSKPNLWDAIKPLTELVSSMPDAVYQLLTPDD